MMGSMTDRDSDRRDEPAHDVLAADEFAVPAPDPALHVEPAHDVLAAEAFPVPSGSEGPPPVSALPSSGGGSFRGTAARVGLGLLAIALIRRRFRRR
jgi:hypothetical protein